MAKQVEMQLNGSLFWNFSQIVTENKFLLVLGGGDWRQEWELNLVLGFVCNHYCKTLV